MSGHGEDSSLKTVLTAVAVNVLIMIAKYAGWFFGGRSPAMLAEAIHTTADVGNQVLLWVGIRQSEKAATPEHPYGWGAARWLWNMKSAMGIFFLGCGVTAYHGVHAFEHWWEDPHAEQARDPWALGVLLFSFVLESFSFVVAMKGINKDRGETPFFEFLQQGDDPTGVGVLLEDAAAILGVILALVGIGLSELLNTSLPDAIATLLIACLLGFVAYFLAKSNGRLLVGVSIGKTAEDRIRAALKADPIVERIGDLKTEVIGAGKARVLVELDLHERILALRMKDDLDKDAARLKAGADPLPVLVGVAARTVKVTAAEIQRLHGVIDDAVPEACFVDIELLEEGPKAPAPALGTPGPTA